MRRENRRHRAARLEVPPNQRHRADIKKMLVHRASRGRGIGAALMVAVEEEARQRGRWLVVLDTVPGENGHRLYLRAGFQQSASCRITRCFPTAGSAIPRSCGSG